MKLFKIGDIFINLDKVVFFQLRMLSPEHMNIEIMMDSGSLIHVSSGEDGFDELLHLIEFEGRRFSGEKHADSKSS